MKKLMMTMLAGVSLLASSSVFADARQARYVPVKDTAGNLYTPEWQEDMTVADLKEALVEPTFVYKYFRLPQIKKGEDELSDTVEIKRKDAVLYEDLHDVSLDDVDFIAEF